MSENNETFQEKFELYLDGVEKRYVVKMKSDEYGNIRIDKILDVVARKEIRKGLFKDAKKTVKSIYSDTLRNLVIKEIEDAESKPQNLSQGPYR